MNKKRYYSPEFSFKELFLFEGVADVCWGYHHCDMHIFFDENHDNTYNNGDTMLFEHNFTPSEGGQGQGCSNIDTAIEEAMASIQQAFIDAGYERYWNESVRGSIMSHPNAGQGSAIYIPIHS